MADLLDTLMQTQDAASPVNLPIRVLADWFFSDCAARNLQDRTVDFYRHYLRYLTDAAGDRPPTAVTTAEMKTLVSYYREKRNWTVGTTNHAITTWKVFFHYLFQEEIIDQDPAKRLKKLKGAQLIPEALTPDEIHTLLADAGEGFVGIRNTAMLLVLLDCGLRLQELIGLKVEDIDFTNCQLLVFGKGRKERLVPFSGPVRRMLLKYLTHRHTRTHEKVLWIDEEGVPFTDEGFRSFLARLEKRTGVRVHAHKFRHTFASQYIADGGNPAYLQRLLGHTTPIMTNRYVHLMDTDAREDHRAASPVTHLLGPRWRGRR